MSGPRAGGEAMLYGRPAGGLLSGLRERARRWLRREAGGAPAAPWQAALDEARSFAPGTAGLRLTCQAGTFLVTQEADPCDHPLEPGESFQSAPRGKVVAWALRAGSLEVRAMPRGSAPGRRAPSAPWAEG